MGKKESPESEKLKKYLALMEAENLQELEMSDGKTKIRLVRQSGVVTVSSPVFHQSAAPKPAPAGNAVTAPIAGVFYRSPSPSAPSFVSEGDHVATGQVVCIIEAMKVMNEITAEKSGRISKVLVENGKPVEAGQALFMMESN